MQMQSHDKDKNNYNMAQKLMLLRLRLKVCYLLLLVIIAQLMIPALLLMYSLDNSDVVSFCPSSADGISRAVAFALGCIYQVRIMLLLGSKQCEPVDVVQERSTRLLRFLLKCDSFMNIIYELCVYFINLWIVFFTSDPLEMVLNALALEFVLQLDDVAKEKYIAIFAKHRYCKLFRRYQDTFKQMAAPQPGEGADVATAKEKEATGAEVLTIIDGAVVDVPQEEHGAETSGERANICDLINYIVVFVVAQFVLPILTLFYLPICKPQ
jgi:hypothetical protein